MAVKPVPALPAPGPNETVERACRKIDNGYVIRESRYGEGGYQSREFFSETVDGSTPAPAASGPVNSPRPFEWDGGPFGGRK